MTMSKTAALKIARHLHSPLYPFGRGQYCYNYAIQERGITQSQPTDYKTARARRTESIKNMVEILMDGKDWLGNEIPDWMNLNFKW